MSGLSEDRKREFDKALRARQGGANVGAMPTPAPKVNELSHTVTPIAIEDTTALPTQPKRETGGFTSSIGEPIRNYLGSGDFQRPTPFMPADTTAEVMLNTPEAQELLGGGYDKQEVQELLRTQLKNPTINTLANLQIKHQTEQQNQSQTTPTQQPKRELTEAERKRAQERLAQLRSGNEERLNQLMQPTVEARDATRVATPTFIPAEFSMAGTGAEESVNAELTQLSQAIVEPVNNQQEQFAEEFEKQTGFNLQELESEYASNLYDETVNALNEIKEDTQKRIEWKRGEWAKAKEDIKNRPKEERNMIERFYNTAEEDVLIVLTDQALKDIDAKTKADAKEGKKGSGLWQGIRDNTTFDKVFSFGLSSWLDDDYKASVLNKHTRGDKLTVTESNIVKLHGLEQQAQEYLELRGGQTYGSQGGAGVAHSIPYMVNLFATSGIGSVGKLAVTGAGKAVLKAGGKKAVAKAVQAGANTTAKALAMTPFQGGLYQGLAEQDLEQYVYDDKGELIKEATPAFTRGYKAFAGMFAEVLSEQMGEFIGLPFKYAGKKMYTHLGLSKLVGDKTHFNSKALQALKDRVSWNGFIGEYGEEMFGNLLEPILTGEPEDIPEAFSKENLWVTAISTAVMSGGFSVLEAPKAINYGVKLNSLRKSELNALKGIESDQLKQDIYNALQESSIEAKSKALAGIEWGNYTPIDVAHSGDFIRARLFKEQYIEAKRANDNAEQLVEFADVQANNLYQGEDGATPTDKFLLADVEGIGTANILAGDLMPQEKNTTIVVRDSNGETHKVKATDIKSRVAEFSSEEYLQAGYNHIIEENTFESIGEDAIEVIEVAKEAELPIEQVKGVDEVYSNYEVGDEIETKDGTKGVITNRQADGFIVQLSDENNNTHWGRVPFNHIQKPSDLLIEETPATNEQSKGVIEIVSEQPAVDVQAEPSPVDEKEVAPAELEEVTTVEGGEVTTNEGADGTILAKLDSDHYVIEEDGEVDIVHADDIESGIDREEIPSYELYSNGDFISSIEEVEGQITGQNATGFYVKESNGRHSHIRFDEVAEAQNAEYATGETISTIEGVEGVVRNATKKGYNVTLSNGQIAHFKNSAVAVPQATDATIDDEVAFETVKETTNETTNETADTPIQSKETPQKRREPKLISRGYPNFEELSVKEYHALLKKRHKENKEKIFDELTKYHKKAKSAYLHNKRRANSDNVDGAKRLVYDKRADRVNAVAKKTGELLKGYKQIAVARAKAQEKARQAKEDSLTPEQKQAETKQLKEREKQIKRSLAGTKGAMTRRNKNIVGREGEASNREPRKDTYAWKIKHELGGAVTPVERLLAGIADGSTSFFWNSIERLRDGAYGWRNGLAYHLKCEDRASRLHSIRGERAIQLRQQRVGLLNNDFGTTIEDLHKSVWEEHESFKAKGMLYLETWETEAECFEEVKNICKSIRTRGEAYFMLETLVVDRKTSEQGLDIMNDTALMEYYKEQHRENQSLRQYGIGFNVLQEAEELFIKMKQLSIKELIEFDNFVADDLLQVEAIEEGYRTTQARPSIEDITELDNQQLETYFNDIDNDRRAQEDNRASKESDSRDTEPITRGEGEEIVTDNKRYGDVSTDIRGVRPTAGVDTGTEADHRAGATGGIEGETLPPNRGTSQDDVQRRRTESDRVPERKQESGVQRLDDGINESGTEAQDNARTSPRATNESDSNKQPKTDNTTARVRTVEPPLSVEEQRIVEDTAKELDNKIGEYREALLEKKEEYRKHKQSIGENYLYDNQGDLFDKPLADGALFEIEGDYSDESVEGILSPIQKEIDAIEEQIERIERTKEEIIKIALEAYRQQPKLFNDNQKQDDNVYNRPRSGQRDSHSSTTEVQENAGAIPSDRRGGRETGDETTRRDNREGEGHKSGLSDTGILPPTVREQGDNQPHYRDRESGAKENDARTIDGRGDDMVGESGLPISDTDTGRADKKGDKGASETFKERTERKIKEQAEAESIAVKLNNKGNIEDTLPLLLPPQIEDVAKAEHRFFSDKHKQPHLANGKGFLFTNGTGTGKTYTGLGIIKRFTKLGKKDILIVVPTQPKVTDWIETAQQFKLDIYPLQNMKDKGEGVTITTFMNFQGNDAICDREFDLIVYDESHRIMESAKGDYSNTTDKHFIMTNRNQFDAITRLVHNTPVVTEIRAINEQLNELGKIPPVEQSDSQKSKVTELQHRKEQLVPKVDKLRKEREAEADKPVERTKVLFLSATPFKSVLSLRYVNGFLIDWHNDSRFNTGDYQTDGETQFLLDTFSSQYEWKNNQVQQRSDANPESIALQEIEFTEGLFEQGLMSGRTIESEQDYSRDFPLVAGLNTDLFNKAYSAILSNREDTYQPLRPFALSVFSDYNYSTQLLESLRTSMSISRINQHLDMGRKVVLFHRRQQADTTPPFATIIQRAKDEAGELLREAKNLKGEKETESKNAQTKAVLILRACSEFEKNYSQLLEYEQTLNYDSAVEQVTKAFGDRAVFVNGLINKRDKNRAIREFNKDDSNVDIIVLQEESGKEGISLHDTTGKHQRVTMSMSLPNSSITCLQIEGRTYRIGQESNAIFEYPLIGLDFEVAHFAGSLNRRLSTTENLAVGKASRDLIRSFSDGVIENRSQDAPSEQQGVGGKEADKRSEEDISPLRRAITAYDTRQKNRRDRANKQGVDFYATPEPVGLKMVELLGLKENETVLEPSAGSGSIARWIPPFVRATAIEPEADLRGELLARMQGANPRVEGGVFEDFAVINKYDGIVMNPPFGRAGAIAISHIEKALRRHLNVGGRLVALIPTGAMTQKLDKLLYGVDKQGKVGIGDFAIVARVKLPTVTFEKESTNVSTELVVIDRFPRHHNSQNRTTSVVEQDLSYCKTIDELFKALPYVTIPSRLEVEEWEKHNNPHALEREQKEFEESLPLFGTVIEESEDEQTITEVAEVESEQKEVAEERQKPNTVEELTKIFDDFATNAKEIYEKRGRDNALPTPDYKALMEEGVSPSSCCAINAIINNLPPMPNEGDQENYSFWERLCKETGIGLKAILKPHLRAIDVSRRVPHNVAIHLFDSMNLLYKNLTILEAIAEKFDFKESGVFPNLHGYKLIPTDGSIVQMTKEDIFVETYPNGMTAVDELHKAILDIENPIVSEDGQEVERATLNVYEAEDKKSFYIGVEEADGTITPVRENLPSRLRARLQLNQNNAQLQKEYADKKAGGQKQSSTRTAPIEDYGEKIGGARKDLVSEYRELANTPIDHAIGKSLKELFPEPNYKKLIDEGVNQISIAYIYSLRKYMPRKPRSYYKQKQWANQVIRALEASHKVIKRVEGGWSDFNSYVKELSKVSAIGTDVVVTNHKILESFGFFKSGEITDTKGLDIRKAKDTFILHKNGVHIKSFFNLNSAVEALHNELEEATAKAKPKKRKKIALNVYVNRESNSVFIGRKRSKGDPIEVRGGFKTTQEALAYLKENREELESYWDKMSRIPNHRDSKTANREGHNWRKRIEEGNVTTEEFSTSIGLRAIEFGNWVTQEERQELLNEAYDAFFDLAEVIEKPVQSLSLGGQLAIGFGSRGRGGRDNFTAHFESDKNVINLTRHKGAGSLAHEWWHAIDNHLAKRGLDHTANSLTENARSLKYGKWLNKSINLRNSVIEAFVNLQTTLSEQTKMYERARELDNTRTKDYWTLRPEVSARAFEAYVSHKLAEKGYSNPYLVGYTAVDNWLNKENGTINNYPYPLPQEQEALNEAFDELFSSLNVSGSSTTLTMFRDGDGQESKSKKSKELQDRLERTATMLSANFDVGINFVRSPMEIEDDNSARLRRKRKAKGWYDIRKDEVTIVLYNIESTFDLHQTMLHEIIGHKGLRGAFGNNLDTLLDRVWDNFGKDYQDKLLKEHGNKYEATEEYLARMAEGEISLGIFDKIVAQVRGFLTQMLGVSLRVSDNDIIFSLWRAKNHVKPSHTLGERTRIIKQTFRMLERLVPTKYEREMTARREAKLPERVGEAYKSRLQDTADYLALEDFVKRNGISSYLLRKSIDPFVMRMYREILPTAYVKEIKLEASNQRKADRMSGLEIKSNEHYIMNAVKTFFHQPNLKMILGSDTFNVLMEYLIDNMPKNIVNRIANRSYKARVKRLHNQLNTTLPAIQESENKKNDRFLKTGKVFDKSSLPQRFVRAIQNEHLPVKQFIERVSKNYSYDISTSTDMENALNQWSSIANARMEHYKDKHITPLLEVLSEIEERTQSGFDGIIDYITCESALERDGTKMPVFPLEPNTQDWSREYAISKVADFRSHFTGKDEAIVERLWKTINDANVFILDELITAGLLTPQDKAKIRGYGWKYYVPLIGWNLDADIMIDPIKEYDFGDQIATRKVTNKPFMQQAEGRVTRPYNPISNMLNFGMKAIISAKRNEAMQFALRYCANLKADKGEDIANNLFMLGKIYYVQVSGEWIPVSPHLAPDLDAIEESGEIAKKIAELYDQHKQAIDKEEYNEASALIDTIREYEKQESVRVHTSDSKFRGEVPIGLGDSMKRAVEVYVNGVRNVIIFRDPAIAEAINGNSITLSKYIENSIGSLTRWLSSAFTSLSPAFVITNAFRDIQHSAIFHALDKEHGQFVGFTKNLPKTFSAVYRGVRQKAEPLTLNEMKRYDITNKSDKGELITLYGEKRVYDTLYNYFIENGGATGFVYAKDVEVIEKEIKRYISLNTTIGETYLSKSWNKTQKGVIALVEWTEAVAEVSENCSRFATFLASLDAGSTIFDAVADAKNITVNFNRRGTHSRVFGQLYIFFNATVQALAQTKKIAVANPERTALFATAMIAKGYLASYLADIATTLIGSDDDDEEHFIPSYVRESNLVIPLFTSKGYLKIPLPQGLRVFHSWGTHLYDTTQGYTSSDDCVKEMLTALWEEHSPMPAPKNASFARTIAPSVLTPFIDSWQNRDVFGRPIGKQSYSDITPLSELGLRNANRAIYQVCRTVNMLGGGDDKVGASIGKDGSKSHWKELLFEWNPSHIQHTAEYFAGGTIFGGTIFWNGINTAKSLLGMQKFETRELPILNRIFGETYKYTPYQDYYQKREEVSRLHKVYNSYKRENNSKANQTHLLNNENRHKFLSEIERLRKQMYKSLGDVHPKSDEYEELSLSVMELMKAYNIIDNEVDWRGDNWSVELDNAIEEQYKNGYLSK